MPAAIAMHWSEDQMLWLRVEGLEGMSYRIQMSHDLETWVDFADALGPLTELPIPQDLSEGGRQPSSAWSRVCSRGYRSGFCEGIKTE